MIVLDTNVISEPAKPQPNLTVRDWFHRQRPGSLYITSISLMDMLEGVGRMPVGRRRSDLHGFVTETVMKQFEILNFDTASAASFMTLSEIARGKGWNLPLADGMIGAIAHAHSFAVATRDTAPFEAMGLRVLNPFEA